MSKRRSRSSRAGGWRGLPLAVLSCIALLAALAVLQWNQELREWFSHLNDPVVKQIDVTQINSPYAVMIHAKGGKSLCESLADELIFPASMTKLMTAAVTFDKVPDLDVEITLGEEAFQGLEEADAAQAGFAPGETVSVRDLLCGCLLASGAECSRALACYVSGSEEMFALLMNQKAQKLGMKQTHFCNATGLHDPEHYSTVRDIAVLLKYLIHNPDFCSIVEHPAYTTAPTDFHPEGLTLYSTLYLELDDPTVTGGRILGGKTGFTSAAGQCLASYAEIEGRRYILVTAGAPADAYPLHVYDALELYDRVGREAQRLKYEGDENEGL